MKLVIIAFVIAAPIAYFIMSRFLQNYEYKIGIADDRITANGYGGSQPVTTNDSEAHRAQNRRVEFIVKK